MTLASDDVFLISRLETLRLLTQPLRLRLLELLRTSPEPLCVKEMATALGVPQTRLYHHINLLEEHGLIRVVATRLVAGITEKRYAATAARIGVDRTLLAPAGDDDGTETLEAMLAVILDEVRAEIRRAVRAGLIDLEHSRENEMGPRRLVLGRKWYRLSDEELVRFNEAMAVAAREFAYCEVEPGEIATAQKQERQFYELLLGFYPAVAPVTREAPVADGTPDMGDNPAT